MGGGNFRKEKYASPAFFHGVSAKKQVDYEYEAVQQAEQQD